MHMPLKVFVVLFSGHLTVLVVILVLELDVFQIHLLVFMVILLLFDVFLI